MKKSKTFDSIPKGETKQIERAYSLPKETVTAMIMLYKNTKTMVRSSGGDSDFFEITLRILQGNTVETFRIRGLLRFYLQRKYVNKTEKRWILWNKIWLGLFTTGI